MEGVEKKRSEKGLLALERRLKDAESLGLNEKYAAIFSLASQYARESRQYFERGDFFSSFGCSDYAYGLLDALLILEGKKEALSE
ncbi:MAG: DUF357 domain-containing protein [Candidatus Bilamarchaeaceae archaeon]